MLADFLHGEHCTMKSLYTFQTPLLQQNRWEEHRITNLSFSQEDPRTLERFPWPQTQRKYVISPEGHLKVLKLRNLQLNFEREKYIKVGGVGITMHKFGKNQGEIDQGQSLSRNIKTKIPT
jgi:hypothetical protein